MDLCVQNGATHWTPAFKLSWGSECNNLYIEMARVSNCVSESDSYDNFKITILSKLSISLYSCGYCSKILALSKDQNWANNNNVIEYGRKYKITGIDIDDELRKARVIAFSFDYSYTYEKCGKTKHVKIDCSCDNDEYIKVQVMNKC